VNFQLSSDQVALRDGLLALLDGRYDLDAVRSVEGAPSVVDRSRWNELANAGVFSILTSEANGGLGLGRVEAAVALEALGAHLVPGPLVGSIIAGQTMSSVASGDVLVGLHNRTSTGAFPRLVELPNDCDGYLVLPGASEGAAPVTYVERTAIDTTPVATSLDPLWPVAQLAQPIADGQEFASAADPVRRDALLLTAAYEVGLASFSLWRAVGYAKDRHQFNRPIGSFQAIKHLLADELARLEQARVAVAYAATITDQPEVAVIDGEVNGLSATECTWRAVASAKLLADTAALSAAKTAVQVHGGMGYTWEVPIHLAMKRARVLATTLGTSDQMAEIVAALTR
jgi:alkylation response protein AidB-like acyl-CoA dehydrogenase